MKNLFLKIMKNTERYLKDDTENEETVICNDQLFSLKTLCNYYSDTGEMCFSINIYAPSNAPMQYSDCHLGSINLKKEGDKPTFISNSLGSLGCVVYDTRIPDPNFDHEGTLRSEVNFVKSVNSLFSDIAEQTFEFKDALSDMMETSFNEFHQ